MKALAMEARTVLARIRAEENGVEKREAPDSELYTKHEFEEFFGDLTLWRAAIEEPEAEAPAQPSKRAEHQRAGGSAKRAQPAGTGRAAGVETDRSEDAGTSARAATGAGVDTNATTGGATPRGAKPRAKYVKGRGRGGGGAA